MTVRMTQKRVQWGAAKKNSHFRDSLDLVLVLYYSEETVITRN